LKTYSAVAGLIETARYVSTTKPSLDYGIDFVAYCLEEPPFFATQEMGSYIRAKSLYNNQVDVLGMICYEMIGFFSEEPDSQIYHDSTLEATYPSEGNFIAVVGIDYCKKFNTKFYQSMLPNAGIDI